MIVLYNCAAFDKISTAHTCCSLLAVAQLHGNEYVMEMITVCVVT